MMFYRTPLGAIIRKGGLGLPIIFAVLIFISFHFINTFGKKIAQENGMSPFMGVDVVIYPVTTSYIVNLSRNK
jgi:lipopolysaccharide export system permease protein